MQLDSHKNSAATLRFSNRFLVAALFCFVFIISFTRIHNGDIWWSLAEGRQIATAHSLQNTNLFSFTFPDHPWNSAQWLFSTFVYLIHLFTGIAGLFVLKIILFLILVYFLFKTLEGRRANIYILLALIIIYVLSIHFRIMIRAHLSSLLLFNLYLLLIDRYRTGTIKTLWWLPVIAVVWTNLHSGVVFGLALLALVAVEDSVAYLLNNQFSFKRLLRENFFRHYLLIGLASLAGTVINPQGPYWLIHSFSHLNVDNIIAISEYLPPWKLGPGLLPYFFLVGVVVLTAILRLLVKYRFQPYDLVVPVFLALSLSYNRIVPYFCALAIVHVGITLGRLNQNIKSDRLSLPSNNRLLVDLLLGTAIILAPLFLIGKLSFLPNQTDFGAGVNHYRLPVSATAFLKENPVPGSRYNNYFWGGYLAWHLYPDQPVYIDGRVPAYPADFVRQAGRVRTDFPAFREQDDKYHFQSLIIGKDEFSWNISKESGDSIWVLAYWDRTGTRVYVRNDPANADYIVGWCFTSYLPGFNILQYDRLKGDFARLVTLKTEIERHQHWTGEKLDRRILTTVETDISRHINQNR